MVAWNTDAFSLSLWTGICFAITYCIVSYWKKFTFWSSRGVPGPFPLPIFGNSLSFVLKPTPTVDDENCRKYGRIYGTYEGTNPVLVIHDAFVLQQVFQQQFSSFSDRLRDTDDAFDDFKAKNHVYANGEAGRNFRKTVALSSANTWLEEMCQRIDGQALVQKVGKSGDQHLRLFDFLSTFCFTSTSLSMFGIDMSADPHFDDLMREMEKLGPAGSPFTKLPYLNNWIASRIPIRISRAIGLLPDASPGMKFFSSLLTGMLQERSTDKSAERRDVTQAFADAVSSARLSTNQSISSCSVIMALAAGGRLELICCLLYELAKNPDEQAKMHQEIDRHKNPLSFESLTQMEYMAAAILEILRLYPLEMRVNRHVSVPDGVVINGTGIHLPHGTTVHVPTYSLARDPEYWDRPESFDPSRFLPQNKDKLVPCAYMPFGAGPRMCPGIRMTQYMVKEMIIPILKEYRVTNAQPEVLHHANNSREISTVARQITVSFIKRQ